MTYSAQAYIASALNAVVFSSMMWMNVVNTRIFFGTRIEPRMIWGAAIGMAGLLVLFWPSIETVSFTDRTLLGAGLSLSGAVMASLGNMVSHRAQREGLPIVSLQAAYMGRPIVGTMAGGLPEVVEHGATGWLCPVDDEAALANALETALSRPGELRRMSDVAVARARAELDWRATVDRYDELYRRLAEAERDTEGAA